MNNVADMTEVDVAFRPCQKTKPANAVQIEEDFVVNTWEGQMNGKAGDYLMQGIKGERYICKKEIFEESYEWLEE